MRSFDDVFEIGDRIILTDSQIYYNSINIKVGTKGIIDRNRYMSYKYDVVMMVGSREYVHILLNRNQMVLDKQYYRDIKLKELGV